MLFRSRATKASTQAEQARRDADQHALQLVTNAKKNADQILAQAKSQADQLLADTKAEAERHRSSAQRHVDDLNKQKESVAAHLAQISQLLGNQMSGLGAAMQPAAPAVAGSPAKAVTAAPQANGGSQAAPPAPPAPAAPPRQGGAPAGQAPAGGQNTGGQNPGGRSGGQAGGAPGPKQTVNAKSAKAGDNEDWWVE